MEKSRIFQLITETSEFELIPDESGKYSINEDEIVSYTVFVNNVYHLDILDKNKKIYANVRDSIINIIKNNKFYRNIKVDSYDNLMKIYPESKYKHYEINTLIDLGVMLEETEDEHKQKLYPA